MQLLDETTVAWARAATPVSTRRKATGVFHSAMLWWRTARDESGAASDRCEDTNRCLIDAEGLSGPRRKLIKSFSLRT